MHVTLITLHLTATKPHHRPPKLPDACAAPPIVDILSPTTLLTSKNFAEHRSMQTASPLRRSPSAYRWEEGLGWMHLVWHELTRRLLVVLAELATGVCRTPLCCLHIAHNSKPSLAGPYFSMYILRATEREVVTHKTSVIMSSSATAISILAGSTEPEFWSEPSVLLCGCQAKPLCADLLLACHRPACVPRKSSRRHLSGQCKA